MRRPSSRTGSTRQQLRRTWPRRASRRLANGQRWRSVASCSLTSVATRVCNDFSISLRPIKKWGNYLSSEAAEIIPASEAQRLNDLSAEELPTQWVERDKNELKRSKGEEVEPDMQSRLVARGDLPRIWTRSDSPTADKEAVFIVFLFSASRKLRMKQRYLDHGYFQGEKLSNPLVLNQPAEGRLDREGVRSHRRGGLPHRLRRRAVPRRSSVRSVRHSLLQVHRKQEGEALGAPDRDGRLILCVYPLCCNPPFLDLGPRGGSQDRPRPAACDPTRTSRPANGALTYINY